MKLGEFSKLKPTQKLYDTERDEFTTKKEILNNIVSRAKKIARSGYSLEGDKDYIYGWLVDRVELVNETRVNKEVQQFLNKHRLNGKVNH